MYIYIGIYANTYIHICICTHRYVYICVHVYTWMYTNMYVYICLFTREREEELRFLKSYIFVTKCTMPVLILEALFIKRYSPA